MMYSKNVIEFPTSGKEATHVDNDWDSLYDYETGSEVDYTHIEPGKAIRVLKDNYLRTYLVESLCDRGFHGIMIDSQVFVDVYKWDFKNKCFTHGPIMIGDPDDLLYETEGVEADTGDVILLTRHGDQNTIATFEYNSQLNDPTGLYLMAESPVKYGGTEEEDDDDEDASNLELLPLYRIMTFYDDHIDTLTQLTDVVNQIVEESDE